jgi:hypothetical protein
MWRKKIRTANVDVDGEFIFPRNEIFQCFLKWMKRRRSPVVTSSGFFISKHFLRPN